MKNFQKGFIVPLIIIIVAILAIGGGVYYYTQNSSGPEVQTNNQATSTPQIADWKTFTNSEYGIEFKYPKDLFDDVSTSSYITCDFGSQKPHAQLFFANYDTGTDLNTMSVSICDGTTKDKLTKLNKALVTKEINGKTAYMYSVSHDNTEQGLGGYSENKIVVIPFNSYSIQVSFFSGYGVSDRAKLITADKNDENDPMHQILSTFKSNTVPTVSPKTTANDSATGLQIYTNSKYGFSIGYPPVGDVSDQGKDNMENPNNRFIIGLQSNSSPVQRVLYLDIREMVAMNECSNLSKDTDAAATSVTINGITFIKGNVDKLYTSSYADQYCAVHNGFVYRLTSRLSFSSSIPAPSRSDLENDTTINKVVNSFKFTSPNTVTLDLKDSPLTTTVSTPTIAGTYNGDYGVKVVVSKGNQVILNESSDHGGIVELSSYQSKSGTFTYVIPKPLEKGEYSIKVYVFHNIYTDQGYVGDSPSILTNQGTLTIR